MTSDGTSKPPLFREWPRLLLEQDPLHQRELYFQTVARLLVDEPDASRLALCLAEQLTHIFAVRQALVGLMVNYEILVEQLICDHTPRPLHRRFTAKDEAIGWVMTHKRPFVCADAQHDPQLSKAFVEEFGCRTLLVVPILNHQRHLLGILAVHNRTDEHPFDANNIERLQMIALQVAPAVERAQLFNKMGSWASAVANLMAFNAALNRHLDPPVLIRRLVEHAAGFLGATAGLAGLADGARLVSDGYWQRGKWQTFEGQWRVHDGLPGWVLFNECTYLTNNYQSDLLANPHFAQTYGVVSALCVPIMDAREQVLGFFELHNKGDGREPFTWSDAQFMESLANTAAVALRNARLLQEVETQREQLRALAARNATLLEDERHRIARELHDETGQVLTGVKLSLQALTRKIPQELPVLRTEADRLRQQINDSTAQLKGIAHKLRPPTLDVLGLLVALQQLVNDFQKRTNIATHISADIDQRLPQAVETACFRITQEALTNITRHANATQVCISLMRHSQDFQLIIGDNGCGFDLKQMPNAGLGLLGMKERTLMLGGALDIRSQPGQGTLIEVTIPVQ